MLPTSAIAKGKLLECHIADTIVEMGLDPKACRSAGSGNGNREKADINTNLTILGRNAGFEAKNHKTLAIPEWWKQAEQLEKIGREPVLVFKLRGEPLEGSLATIRLNTLLELIKRSNAYVGAKEPTGESEKQRALRWALNDLMAAVKKVVKLLV